MGKKLRINLCLLLKRKTFNGHVILTTKENVTSRLDSKYFDHELVLEEIITQRGVGFSELFFASTNDTFSELKKVLMDSSKEKLKEKVRVISVEQLDL